MNTNLTEMIFIIDRSGSMSSFTSDTINGYNSMIQEQKKNNVNALITTVLFDHEYQIINDATPIQEVNPLTENEYYARGTTALLDTIAFTLTNVGSRLYNTNENDRPHKVIVTIITDGQENASKIFGRNSVKEMIEHQQNVYSWEFMFIGSNLDAITEASSLGININNATNYTSSSAGITSVYNTVSNVMKEYSSSGVISKSWNNDIV